MKIRIHKDTWKVKIVNADKKKMNPDEDHYNLGLTEYDTLVINIRKGMPRSVMRSTVIHELTHAFCFSYANAVNGEEAMCDFFGVHGDEIIRLADLVMERMVDSAYG